MTRSQFVEDVTEIASTDFLTYAFDGAAGYDRETKPLLICAEDPTLYLTSAQTRSLTQQVISGLKHAGVGLGDRVLVHLPNTIAQTCMTMGIIGAGAIYVPSNPAYRAFELNHLLNLSKPALIITIPALLPLVSQCAREQNIPESALYSFDTAAFASYVHTSTETKVKGNHHIPEFEEDSVPRTSSLGTNGNHTSSNGNHTGSSGDHIASNESHTASNGVTAKHTIAVEQQHETSSSKPFESLLQHGESDWLRLSDTAAAQSTYAVLLPTSGTTGHPKLAVFSHFTVIAMLETIFDRLSRDASRLMYLPLFLGYGFLIVHAPTLRWGFPTYIMERFQMDQCLRLIREHSIEEFLPVGAMVNGWVKQREVIQQFLGSVRFSGTPGGVLSEENYKTYKSMLHPDAIVMGGWGMTEAGPLSTTAPGDPFDSIGRMYPGQEIKLVGAKGQVVEVDGEPGEAYVRSWCGFTGYWQADGTITRPRDDDGWFRTGDVLTRKGECLFFVGRSKELIKVKNWSISPTEIESLILTHPKVADCAVVGVPISEGLDRPRAYVVLRPESNTPASNCSSNETPSEPAKSIPQTVYDFARSNLAGYKALDGGVYTVEAIPRNPFGKIQRFLLPGLKHLEYMEPALLDVLRGRAEDIAKVGA